MEVKILSPLWGHEKLKMKTFLYKVMKAGFDGVDSWIPTDPVDQKIFFDFLQKHEMYHVCHQHEAMGSTFKKFKADYVKRLKACAVEAPILINSHTGKDFFTFEQNLELVDAAIEFSTKTGITVAHETHRGRLGYCPQATADFLKNRDQFYITADFSHWVCVTESMLENFEPILKQAILRSRHIHARIGFEEGPQVPDPRDSLWEYAVTRFLGLWDQIVKVNEDLSQSILPITTEFGTFPYMARVPFSQKTLANQFDINCYMKDLLRERYCD